MDKIIVKKSLHSGSFLRTVWRFVVLSGAFIVFFFLVIGLLASLFSFDIITTGVCGIGLYWIYKYFGRNAIGIAKGREIAVISSEGVFLNERGTEVMPWENIREIGVYSENVHWRAWIFAAFGMYSSVGFKFKNKNERFETVCFSAHFTNYTTEGIVEVMEKFKAQHHA